MAVDKLVDSTQLDADLTSVANAIRTKGGTSSQLAFPSGFVSAVQAIPTGTTPTGTKQISITQNGTTTEDVTNYASAEITVNVSGGASVDDILLGSYPVGAITITLSSPGTRERVFMGCTNITSVSAPNLTSLRQQTFSGCTGITSIDFPELSSVNGSQQFLQCSNLISVNVPKLATLGANMFQACSSLEIIDLPVATSLNYARVFYGCSALQTIILRNTTLVPISNDGLTNTPFAGTGRTGLTGTLYVPSALVNDYKTATNWSTFYSGGAMQVLAIEGSIYEE